eukprot:Amastigsp_a186879_11.p2 type:complete len:129 gc:universal Amastigsp_a186879_11:115-501(+)
MCAVASRIRSAMQSPRTTLLSRPHSCRARSTYSSRPASTTCPRPQRPRRSARRRRPRRARRTRRAKPRMRTSSRRPRRRGGTRAERRPLRLRRHQAQARCLTWRKSSRARSRLALSRTSKSTSVPEAS